MTGDFFFPFWVRFSSTLKSEARANPERTQSGGKSSIIIIPKKPKIRVPLLRKKKWHYVALDDNNNNNRDATSLPSQFTPQFTVYKANTMTDSHIRPTVNCEM